MENVELEEKSKFLKVIEEKEQEIKDKNIIIDNGIYKLSRKKHECKDLRNKVQQLLLDVDQLKASCINESKEKSQLDVKCLEQQKQIKNLTEKLVLSEKDIVLQKAKIDHLEVDCDEKRKALCGKDQDLYQTRSERDEIRA